MAVLAFGLTFEAGLTLLGGDERAWSGGVLRMTQHVRALSLAVGHSILAVTRIL